MHITSHDRRHESQMSKTAETTVNAMDHDLPSHDMTPTHRAHWPVGAHLVTPRRGYTHHGIYAGNGMVVHYAGFSRSLRRGPVEQVPQSVFAAGHPVRIEPATRPAYTGDEAARRACSRIGENRYRLITHNCEHFCDWCLHGEGHSAQVDRFLAWPRAILHALMHALAQAGRTGSRAAQTQTCTA
jgi:hypothetical protein